MTDLTELIDAYAEARHAGGCHTYNVKTAEARAKVVASLAANAGSTKINEQLYAALNNLFTHLGMEGCITADHAFVWDAMTALKRIDGGVHLDNLAVPIDPDAHRDDMLAAVRLLEGGEWAEHFAKTPIGMRLEDQITRLHSEVAANAGSEPVAAQSRFTYQGGHRNTWTHCSIEHHNMVQAHPEEWPGYETRLLYTHPSPPEGMAGWMPIETAPKDGTEFLAVYGRQGNVQQLARWNKLHGHWESKGNWLPGFESNVTAIHALPAAPGPAEGESNGY